MALGLLHSALRFAPEGSALSDVLDGLQPQLCPLYCSLLAPKPPKGVSKGAGAVAKAGKVVVPGPLAQLPTATQVKNTATPWHWNVWHAWVNKPFVAC